MKIHVDNARCTGHAQCFAQAPSLYEIDEVGYSSITDLDVPPGLEEDARRGAMACPERAISIKQ